MPWVPLGATDEAQLLAATGRGRAIFTFNARDFIPLASKYPRHRGILLAAQRSWTLPELISSLDRLLRDESPEELAGTVRWLTR